MSTHTYQTKMRAHTAAIHGLSWSPSRDEFATVSTDGTIRIWGATSLEQVSPPIPWQHVLTWRIGLVVRVFVSRRGRHLRRVSSSLRLRLGSVSECGCV